MIYGYARVSTKFQGKSGNSLQDQIRKLTDEGCPMENITTEEYTGKTTARPKFDELVNRLQPGDKLIVTKLDRLARNVVEGSKIIQDLLQHGIKVHVLNIGLLEDTSMGMFIVNTLLAVAELERSMILERTQAGKEVARTKAGFKEGRPPIPQVRKDAAVQMVVRDGMTYRQASRASGVSASVICRALQEYKLRK